MPTPARIWTQRLGAAALITAVLVACSGSGGSNHAAPTSVATTPTTVAVTTTTTVGLPPDPQATPLAASTLFIDDWKKHDQAAAALVGVPSAVAALFATPYTNQPVISRGCSMEFVPRTCSWGPSGGGAGALFQIDTSPDGANWYVSGAHVES